MTMPTPSGTPAPQAAVQEADEADLAMEQAVFAAIRAAVGERLAGQLLVTVAQRRVTLAGAVADAAVANAVEKAAAEPPGVLGVHSNLTMGDATPAEVVIPDDVRLPDAAEPAMPAEGQVNHKV